MNGNTPGAPRGSPGSSLRLTIPPNGAMQTTKVFKVVVVGDSGVGKTAFVKTYVFETANLSNSGTVGVDFVVKTVDWKNSVTVKMQVWDIGGQDRSAFLLRVFCHRAHGCVILFDVSNPKTFQNVAEWKREVDDKCLADGRKPVPCLLLANKCDLDERKVRMKDIDQATERLGFIGWKEMSVKDRFNLNESMEMLVDAMIQRTPDPFCPSPALMRRDTRNHSPKDNRQMSYKDDRISLTEKAGLNPLDRSGLKLPNKKKERSCCC